MKNLFLPTLLAAILFNSSITLAQTCNFPPVERLKIGSEISTFVYDFWVFSKDNLKKDFKKFPFVLDGDGPVVGDYHFNNVGAYYNYNESKKTGKVEMAVIDMDDSGSGNQFGDLIKLLLYVKSEFKDDSLTELALEHYVSGLEKKAGDVMPKLDDKLAGKLEDLKAILALSKSDFDLMNQTYATKKMKGNKFDKDWGLKDLSKLDSNRKSDEEKGRKYIEKLGKILDSGFRINESGSSIGAYRFVYLVETKDKIKVKKDDEPVYKIVELKENNCPGTVKYADQENQVDRFKSNRKNLQSEDFWKEAKVVDLGHITYLLRVKQANPLEKLKKDDKNLKAYTAFFAYTLGRIHAPTAHASYVNGLTKNKSEKTFVKATEEFVNEYHKYLAKRTKK